MAKVAKKAAQQRIARAPKPAASTPPTQIETETALYEVLAPFKFRGAHVRPSMNAGDPPLWIEMSADEAQPYQDAGVLGTEAAEVPETGDGDPNNADGAGAGDTANADTKTDTPAA